MLESEVVDLLQRGSKICVWLWSDPAPFVGYLSKKMTEKTLNRLIFLTSKPFSPFSFWGLLLPLLPPPLIRTIVGSRIREKNLHKLDSFNEPNRMNIKVIYFVDVLIIHIFISIGYSTNARYVRQAVQSFTTVELTILHSIRSYLCCGRATRVNTITQSKILLAPFYYCICQIIRSSRHER